MTSWLLSSWPCMALLKTWKSMRSFYCLFIQKHFIGKNLEVWAPARGENVPSVLTQQILWPQARSAHPSFLGVLTSPHCLNLQSLTNFVLRRPVISPSNFSAGMRTTNVGFPLCLLIRSQVGSIGASDQTPPGMPCSSTASSPAQTSFFQLLINIQFCLTVIHHEKFFVLNLDSWICFFDRRPVPFGRSRCIETYSSSTSRSRWESIRG